MVKRCQWGLCNTDDRYPERLAGGVQFIPFPKPRRLKEKCLRWIKLCGRPHGQLNENIVDGNRHLYVCTKHFVEGKPTEIFPDPLPAINYQKTTTTPARKPPRRRALSEPAKKSRKVLTDVNSSENVETVTKIDSIVEIPTADFNKDISPLDMLALTAENQQLKEQMAKLLLKTEELKRANESKPQKTSSLSAQQAPLSVEEVKNNHVKGNFKYYTGFEHDQFMKIFNFLVKSKSEMPFRYTKSVKSTRSMPLDDQLLLTLMKLRQNFDNKHIANLFLLSPQDVSLIFTNWINFMFFQFGSVPIWPHRDVIMDKMPPKFKLEFPNTMVILDGTEIKIQRPSSLTSQSQCYSDYKSATTLKGLVGIDPRGSLTFISMLFSGSMSDKEITSQSGLLDTVRNMIDCGMLQKGDGVMVDKGFNIKDEIDTLGLKLIIPPNAPSEGQMPSDDVSLTKKIAIHRVHVERAISRIKKFKILSERLDLSLFSSVNQIWFVCCFLTNFMPFLIQD